MEQRLPGGWSRGAVRVGATVRRAPGPRAEFSRRLLLFLEDVGFDAAPRFLGYDERGREILTFVEGEVPVDCRRILFRDDELAASAQLLRRFHDTTAGTALAGSAEVVCHNDYGPWNIVWRQRRPVAVFDFDEAEPGTRLDDLGYAVWKHLNIGLLDVPVAEQRRRLGVVLAAYGADAGEALLGAISRSQQRMLRLALAADPGPREAALAILDRERAWLERHGHELVGA